LPRFAGCAALVLVLVRGYMFVAHVGWVSFMYTYITNFPVSIYVWICVSI
jgi:hypothetical protein